MVKWLLNQNKMEAMIIKQEKNAYLKREEYLIEIVSETNPVESEIVEFVGKDKELTTIEKISSQFGKQIFKVEVFVYEDSQAKKEIQTISQKVRKKIEEEKKKAVEEAKKKAKEEAEASAENVDAPSEDVKKEALEVEVEEKPVEKKEDAE